MGNFWTEERVTLLRQLWATEANAAVIARQLGAASKNAVIGKAHRLLLSARQSSTRGRPVRTVERRQPKPAGLTQFNRYMASKGPDDRPMGGPRVQVFQTPAADRKLLADLEPHHCRFPFGDSAPYTFCGHGTVPGLSYCEAHARACTISEAARPTQSRAEGVRGLGGGVDSPPPSMPVTERLCEDAPV
jgi:GcrA cell cycle regulator